MKFLIKSQADLIKAGRCDIDYHLPPALLTGYLSESIDRVDSVAEIVKDKRDPGDEPDELFYYVDISAVDNTVGRIGTPQELYGSEAPSRARKVIRATDVIVSTCRPTRGAIAMVPKKLDGEICSTAFSVLRADPERVMPKYLHWALRLPSTVEQFRKWSTGSSYPAILDEDVAKTEIPVPHMDIQIQVVDSVSRGLEDRDKQIYLANSEWDHVQRSAESLIAVAEAQPANEVSI